MSSLSDKIADIFECLPEDSQQTLMAFAEFLQAKAPPIVREMSAPLDIPRPEEETVIAGIKRLNKTYPMIERATLLNETSALMMQHMMSGKSALDVIDELEVLFEQQYKNLLELNQ